MPDAASNPTPEPKPRGWSLVAAGLLLLALALVVFYTNSRAFISPLTLVVVASIGLAALLLQLRLRRNDDKGQDVDRRIHPPAWLNVLGLIFAVGAVVADFLHLNGNVMIVAALGAVLCFAISGIVVISGFRKRKN